MDPDLVLINNLPSDDDDVRQHPAVKKALKRLVKKARKAAVVGVPYYPIFKQPVVKPKVVYKKSKKARKGMTARAYLKLFKEPTPEFVVRGATFAIYMFRTFLISYAATDRLISNYFFVGPKMMGDEDFDEQCVFGNNV